jgi:hypothetical protein
LLLGQHGPAWNTKQSVARERLSEHLGVSTSEQKLASTCFKAKYGSD